MVPLSMTFALHTIITAELLSVTLYEVSPNSKCQSTQFNGQAYDTAQQQHMR